MSRNLPPWPAGTSFVTTRKLTPGRMIAWAHRVWRVVSIEAVDPGERQQPWRVVIANPTSVNRDERSLRMPDRPHDVHVYDENEHYPVCVKCGGPWPCRELHIRQQAEQDMARSRRYELPGVCPACQEPVTPRQLRQTWPVNLHHWDQNQPVTFHLRQRCESEAIAYDREVRAAGMPSQLGYTDDGSQS